LKHIPHFDILRAVAVMMVLIGHLTPHDSFINLFGDGKAGGTLFFVLSGYLISKILFD
jgi:peptidoglycan/LPS O-acetylase OafA/YrhL